MRDRRIHAWRGDRDAAFDRLERARVRKDSSRAPLNADRIFARLHGDPRDADVMRKVGEAQ